MLQVIKCEYGIFYNSRLHLVEIYSILFTVQSILSIHTYDDPHLNISAIILVA